MGYSNKKFWKELKNFIDISSHKEEKFIFQESEISWELANYLWEFAYEKEEYILWAQNELDIFRDYSRLLKKENKELSQQLNGYDEGDGIKNIIIDDNSGYLN